ncbi:toll/interleukin-1 receptor domain-containing protein [Deinococcus arenicola]|uniref:TIR domain-containing protein n=1 Tax=Deinococcus arenicola TaxID=2994950 RepID=A0ABU4DN54_9DEIO|nr:TIR domain-containing protein [Deinococcus sp. ZS9-10]MDV6373783.1 TIR domain-containing protein [Deinococcus sp. ZS9-10]
MTASTTSDEHPRTFISYAWTTPAHEMRVQNLVDQLRRDGIDALLDKYHLRPGMDADQYMEQVAARGEVGKVIAICDPNYVGKVDRRQGGAGKEGTIMSTGVYDQLLAGGEAGRRFVAVVFDKAEGVSPTPAMFSSSLHIDMSTQELYDANYDELLRFLYDQPRLVAPSIGTRPSHLQSSQSGAITATTWPRASALRRAIGSNQGVSVAFQNYLEAVADTISSMPLAVTEHQFDLQKGLRESGLLLPLRNEFVDLMQYAARHDVLDAAALGDFFEETINRLESIQAIDIATQFHRLLLMELMVFLTAICVRNNRAISLNELTSRTYYRTNFHRKMTPDTFGRIFYIEREFRSIYNSLLGKKWIKPEGDWLFNRETSTGFSHQEMMQADLILLLKSRILRSKGLSGSPWYGFSGPYWTEADDFSFFVKLSSRRNLVIWLNFFESEMDDLKDNIIAALPDQALYEITNDGIGNTEWFLKLDTYGTRP